MLLGALFLLAPFVVLIVPPTALVTQPSGRPGTGPWLLEAESSRSVSGLVECQHLEDSSSDAGAPRLDRESPTSTALENGHDPHSVEPLDTNSTGSDDCDWQLKLTKFLYKRFNRLFGQHHLLQDGDLVNALKSNLQQQDPACRQELTSAGPSANSTLAQFLEDGAALQSDLETRTTAAQGPNGNHQHRADQLASISEQPVGGASSRRNYFRVLNRVFSRVELPEVFRRAAGSSPTSSPSGSSISGASGGISLPSGGLCAQHIGCIDELPNFPSLLKLKPNVSATFTVYTRETARHGHRIVYEPIMHHQLLDELARDSADTTNTNHTGGQSSQAAAASAEHSEQLLLEAALKLSRPSSSAKPEDRAAVDHPVHKKVSPFLVGYGHPLIATGAATLLRGQPHNHLRRGLVGATSSVLGHHHQARRSGINKKRAGPVQPDSYTGRQQQARASGALSRQPAGAGPRHLATSSSSWMSASRLAHSLELPFDLAAIERSQFNASLTTRIIIGGYFAKEEEEWIGELVKQWLALEPCNVIKVSWQDSNRGLYHTAAYNSRIVGRQLSLFLHYLNELFHIDLDKFHLVGHSLGAHIAGFVGADNESRIARITGLDPAGPIFVDLNASMRLDPSDAKFVDILHTNGGTITKGALGLSTPSGHVDYYCNGGSLQPGCYFSSVTMSIMDPVERVACNHRRSYRYFTELIRLAASAGPATLPQSASPDDQSVSNVTGHRHIQWPVAFLFQAKQEDLVRLVQPELALLRPGPMPKSRATEANYFANYDTNDEDDEASGALLNAQPPLKWPIEFHSLRPKFPTNRRGQYFFRTRLEAPFFASRQYAITIKSEQPIKRKIALLARINNSQVAELELDELNGSYSFVFVPNDPKLIDYERISRGKAPELWLMWRHRSFNLLLGQQNELQLSSVELNLLDNYMTNGQLDTDEAPAMLHHDDTDDEDAEAAESSTKRDDNVPGVQSNRAGSNETANSTTTTEPTTTLDALSADEAENQPADLKLIHSAALSEQSSSHQPPSDGKRRRSSGLIKTIQYSKVAPTSSSISATRTQDGANPARGNNNNNHLSPPYYSLVRNQWHKFEAKPMNPIAGSR